MQESEYLGSDEAYNEINEVVAKVFQGRVPFDELYARMQNMTQDEMTALMLIACNKLGTFMNNGEYESPVQAALCLNTSADLFLQAYDNATFAELANVEEVGSA